MTHRYSADRITLGALLACTPALLTALEKASKRPGELPFVISDEPHPGDARGRYMRYLTVWQGVVIVRAVASADEAGALHAELSKRLLGDGT